jgi:DNA invertase Pin-like site-specific DNA recombinase
VRSVVYLRVSTDEQGASGLGLEAQMHACKTWSEREGSQVVGPFQDDLSGADPLHKRPGLLDALAILERGDVLLVAKRDRLGRDPIVVAMIESAAGRKGARIASVAGEGTADDEPGSILMRRMVDAFAEYERLIIASRTRAALQAKRRRSQRAGKVPYGMTVIDDGHRSKKSDRPDGLAEVPAEVAIVAEVKALHAEGTSFRAIARALNARGVACKTPGASWCHASVAILCRRTAS